MQASIYRIWLAQDEGMECKDSYRSQYKCQTLLCKGIEILVEYNTFISFVGKPHLVDNLLN